MRKGKVEAGKKLETTRVALSSREVKAGENIKIGNFNVALFLEQLQHCRFLEIWNDTFEDSEAPNGNNWKIGFLLTSECAITEKL